MVKIRFSKLTLVKVVLWVIIYFSALALIYHTRWFIPYLFNNNNHADVPTNEVPLVWFTVQICTNIIFLYVSFLLMRLFRRYRQTWYFDTGSLKVLDGVIISSLGLAILGAFKIVITNFSEVHIGEWTSIEAVSNLMLRSFTRMLVFESPQTIYLLLSMILWAVKQYVSSALAVKKENELFI